MLTLMHDVLYLCQGPNVLEEIDLVEMGITNAAHRLAILHAASKCPPVSQTGLYNVAYVNLYLTLICYFVAEETVQVSQLLQLRLM